MRKFSTNGRQDVLTDEEFLKVMARIKDGDQAAAEELVRLYEPEIRRAARLRMSSARLRRIVDSIDICQSVLGRFFKNASRGSIDLQKPDELLGLLIVMTRNRVIDEHRRQTTKKRNSGTTAGFVVEDVAAADESPGPQTAAETKELLSEIRARMSADELAVADLRNAGKTWKEVSEELNEPVELLRKRMGRAMDRVRKQYLENGEIDGS